MKSVRRFAWWVLGFNVLVILLGAIVRATGSGAGCGRSWPTCQGELLPGLEGATAVEFTHRQASGLALVLVGILWIWVRRETSRGHPARFGVSLAAASVVLEALIGAMIVLAEWVAEDASVARVVAVPLHLVNTFLLLATLTLTTFWLRGGGRLRLSGPGKPTRLVVAGGVALLLLAGSGAVTALADTLFPKDGLGWDSTTGSHLLTRLRVVHPVLALGGALAAWLIAGRAGSETSQVRRALPWLVAVMLISGVFNVWLGTPLWIQILHLLLADLLWVAYVWASAEALSEPSVVLSPQ